MTCSVLIQPSCCPSVCLAPTSGLNFYQRWFLVHFFDTTDQESQPGLVSPIDFFFLKGREFLRSGLGEVRGVLGFYPAGKTTKILHSSAINNSAKVCFAA